MRKQVSPTIPTPPETTRHRHWLGKMSPIPRPPNSWTSHHTYTSQGATTPHWTEPLRAIYDHQLVLFWKADFLLEIDNQRYPCPAGSFAIVPPGRWHTSYNIDGRPGHRQWCHFDWESAEDYNDTPVMTFHPDSPNPNALRNRPRDLPNKLLHGPIRLPRRVENLMKKLIVQQRDNSERDILLSRATLMELMIELLLPEETGDEEQGTSERLATRIRQLLDEVASRPEPIPPIDSLLSSLGRSYAHLCRLFRQEYGIPPLRYIHASRVGRARLLLAERKLGIAEIAYQLGYEDPGHFTRVFRKITGHTPSAYITEQENIPRGNRAG